MYNAMILPYAQGPMRLSGFLWYQGEADTKDNASAALYSCTFPSMISAWRTAFDNPSLFFSFVQLSTWCALPPSALPEMRQAQMAALKLANVGYATNADHGMGCTIHPAEKQYVSERLAASALALRYGREAVWRSPTYKGAKQQQEAADGDDDDVRLTVYLNDVTASGLHLVTPFNYRSANYGPFNASTVVEVNCSATFPISPTANGSMADQCAFASLHVRGSGWLNATVLLDTQARALVLVARVPPTAKRKGARGASSAVIVGSAYGWGPIPMMSAYDLGSGLPVLPWNESLVVPAD